LVEVEAQILLAVVHLVQQTLEMAVLVAAVATHPQVVMAVQALLI
jgi:hypothetical protein